MQDQTATADPRELKGFPGAKYEGRTKSGRDAWSWKGKWLEKTDKAGGHIEMYDKTRKHHLGKYDPNTGRQLKDPIKTRVSDYIRYGMRFIRFVPMIIVPDMNAVYRALYGDLYVPES